MKEELISVIINVYNGEKYIEKCLNSIINQTYKNLEILIVNDGSTDNTLKICESYEDERIRIITTKNLGLSMSRNVGIENAKGDYFYFIDVDDLVEKDVIEYLYNLCIKYNSKMATCKSIVIYDYNFIVKNEKEKICVKSNEEMLKSNLLSTITNANTIWNRLLRRELFNNLRFENRIINDLALTYKLIILCEKIVYSNQIKYYYLRHKDGITQKKRQDINRIIDTYEVSMDKYNNIKKIYPNFIENEICLLRNIVRVYYYCKNRQACKILEKQGALKIFKEKFSLKMLKFNISKKEKVKLLLFAISPKFCWWIAKYKYKYDKFRIHL